jgi:tetratricopeptide (TPR) repeat protein
MGGFILLTQEEYQQWIKHVRENYFSLPDVVVKEMSNWRNRSVLARALVRAKKYAPAIELFKSILEVDVNIEEKDCFSLSEVEDKVWCLKELAMTLWRTTGKRSKALKYMEEAITLIATYPSHFNFMDRCKSGEKSKTLFFLRLKVKKENSLVEGNIVII